MIKFLIFFLTVLLPVSGYAQVISDVPPNESNNRFLNDPGIISMRPGLSIAGFSNDGSSGLGLQQILNRAYESTSNPEYQTVSQILNKVKEELPLNPDVDQVEHATNILQYLAFEALASFVLEQNGITPQQSNQSYELSVRSHSAVMALFKNALVTLAGNNKLVRKLTGGEPFDDYLNALRSYNNTSRAVDLYLAIENAYQYFGENESLLLNEDEKTALMERFRNDIDILYNEGLKKIHNLSGNSITVTEDELEAGNRPLKGYLALGYASMSIQTGSDSERERFDSYVSHAITRGSEPAAGGERQNYWMYQTDNGNRYWAEGPFYLDFVLKDALIFWHAVRMNEDLDSSFDPFTNDWFLNPVQWLADISTPDGSLPPLDDSNKRPIQSAGLLRWSAEYGNEEIGRLFSVINEKIEEYHGLTAKEDQFYLMEAAIPFHNNGVSEIESSTDPAEEQLVLRHNTAGKQQHYILLNGEKGAAVTSGEGHEQPDQLQLLYYMGEFSFLADPGYDRGNPQINSTWNGYKFSNTMQYNASDVQNSSGFVIRQNEGGLESPYASFIERRKVSMHNEAKLFFEEPAAKAVILSGQVELTFQNPVAASANYNRTVLFMKGEQPYIIDLNDIVAETGRNDFVMRYYGNSHQTATQNGWFFWDYSDRPFASSSDRLFLYTLPLTGNFTEEEESVEIQEAENRDAGGEKQPYAVIRKSYLSNEESDRFTTVSILKIRESNEFTEPEFVSDPQNIRYFTHQVNDETVDLFIFAADSADGKRTVTIGSGHLAGMDFTLRANKTIAFSRLRSTNGTWNEDPEFTVHLDAVSTPDPPANLTVSIENRASGPAAVLTWDEPGENDVEFYEIWKQLRNRPDKTEQPAKKIATSAANEYADGSVADLNGDFEQRWFVKAVSSDSLISEPSNTTAWIFYDRSEDPTEFELFNPYPNPMQKTGRVKYQLAEQSHVTIRVFDLLGRHIITIFQETQDAGVYTEAWDANGMASGIYILRLTAEASSGIAFQKSVMVSLIH